MEMTWLTFGGLFLFFVVIGGRSGATRRQVVQTYHPRSCRACMADHPPFANYCRHCGRQL